MLCRWPTEPICPGSDSNPQSPKFEPSRTANRRIWAATSGPGWTRTTDRHLVRVLPSLLGHGTENWTHRELAPNLRCAEPISCYWTMSPAASAVSHDRSPSAPSRTSRRARFGVPCENRTRLASLEGWCLGRSAKGTWCLCVQRKEGESNSQGRKARPGSSGVPSPVGLPFRLVTFVGRASQPVSVVPSSSLRKASFQACRLQQEESNLHPLLNRQVDYRYRMLD